MSPSVPPVINRSTKPVTSNITQEPTNDTQLPSMLEHQPPVIQPSNHVLQPLSEHVFQLTII